MTAPHVSPLHTSKENTMATGKKTELVQKLYAAFQRADLPTLLEHMTDDIDWGIEIIEPTGVPWHGVGKGKKFAAAFFESLGKESIFTRFEPSDFLEGEASVSCLVTYEATLRRNGKKVTQLQGLTKDEISALTTTQLGAATATQISALTAGQVSALADTQISTFSSTQLGALTTTQIGALSNTAIAALTVGELALLSTKQLSSLTAAQIGALTTTQVARLTTTQMGALTTLEIGGLTSTALATLASTQ